MGPIAMLGGAVLIGIALYAKSTGATYSSISLSLIASSFGQVVLYLGYCTFIHRWLFASTRDLPNPKGGSFLFGNLVPFLNEPWGFPLVQWQSAIATTKSGFYRVLVGPMDLLIPKTSKAVGKVMNQPYIFQKPAAVRDGLAETLGVGLVAAEGATHRRQKKLLTPIYGLDRNRRLVPQMWDKSLVLHEVMQKSVRDAGGSAVLHMHNLTMAAALDIIGVTTVGVDFDSLRIPDQPILQAYQAVFPSSETQTGTEKILGTVLPAFVSPSLLFKLPLPPIRRFHWGIAILRNFCVAQIREKKQEIEENPIDNEDIRQKDVLSALICSGMTDERELVNHLLTILAAGHESTAVTLAWALFKLAQLPDVQERLRKEIAETLPHISSESPSYEVINSMRYLRCFCMELFRLYPAFPGLMREASESTYVEDLLIPRGTQLMVSPYAINRSEELWGPDAEEFRVERWTESHNGGAKSSQAFMTFSSGPRVCIGKDFAALSLKMSLAVLVNRFKFSEAVSGFHPPIQKGTSLKPMGLKIRISEV